MMFCYLQLVLTQGTHLSSFEVANVSFKLSKLFQLAYFAAKDATDDFEDVGHSNTARAMMDEYLVGEIDAATIPAKVNYTAPKQPHYNQDKTPEFVIKILQFLVPLAILGLAVVVRIYTKTDSA
jgi:cytochrome b involved in lipid metabolism